MVEVKVVVVVVEEEKEEKEEEEEVVVVAAAVVPPLQGMRTFRSTWRAPWSRCGDCN